MASVLRVKRRAVGGSAGAPATLKSAEIAYNMQDGKFYVGYGDDGAGNATSIKVFAIHDYVPSSGYTAGASGGLTLTGTVFTVDFTIVAPLASPAFTGNPTAPTQTAGNNSTRIATTAYADAADALKANIASPTFTGTPTAPTPTANDNSLKLATTAYVDTADALKANLVSPTFTGTPSAPTAGAGANSTQLATTAYVDTAVSAFSQGLSPKAGVRVASTANIASLSTLLTIDGITLIAGDRILVKDQSTPAQNGVYIAAVGAWTRATDIDAWTEVPSAYVMVMQGSTQAESGWLSTADPGGTIGSTAMPWVQFTGAGQITAGNGITKTGNALSVNYTGAGITLNGAAITLSANLISLAGITGAADTLAYMTGANTYGSTTLTAFGRSLIDDADAAAGRTTLGLGSMATQAASAVAITGGTVDGVTLDGGTF